MGDARNTLRTATHSAAASRRRAALASFEAIPDPVVVIDRQERVAFVNRHVVHRFGFATAELVGQPFDVLVPGDLRGRRWNSLTEVLQGSCLTAAGLEASAHCKDGDSRAVSIDVGLLELDGERFAVCALRDAPGQRAAASAAAQALNEAQRIARLGIWTWDPLANHHWWSDELYRILQIDPAESRPFERYLQMVHPADRDRINGSAAKIAQGDEIEPFDVRLVLQDGTHKIFHSRGAASFDSTGRPVQLRGTIQDVTEQRATETALRLSDMRYREAQRLAKIGNWEWDLTTNTSWWSDELYSILEEDPRSYASTFDNFIAKIHPDDRQALIAAQQNVAGASYAPTESRVVLPDGREKRIEQLVQPRLDATGRPVAIVGTVHDVT
jgi:PAS domain S-box-containing protein